MDVPTRQRLSAADWIAAALAAIAEGGIRAVAVEPLATRLGATKGSFYWHFADRDALVTAALQHWERTWTEDVIATIETGPPGTARLRRLFFLAMQAGVDGGARVELALQATPTHPLVAPVLSRVTHRRLAYLSSLFVELGFAPAEAHSRGLLAYSAHLGHAQLVHAMPEIIPDAAATPAYADTVIAMLTASPSPGPGSR